MVLSAKVFKYPGQGIAIAPIITRCIVPSNNLGLHVNTQKLLASVIFKFEALTNVPLHIPIVLITIRFSALGRVKICEKECFMTVNQ